MLSYESIMSIDTALNQLYILIYSFEFRIIGIVKGNLNSCQYMNKVIFKILTFNWKEIKSLSGDSYWAWWFPLPISVSF